MLLKSMILIFKLIIPAGCLDSFLLIKKILIILMMYLNATKFYLRNFFKIMLSKGIYFAPSLFEAGFISEKHTNKDINFTIKTAEQAFKKISKSRDIK